MGYLFPKTHVITSLQQWLETPGIARPGVARTSHLGVLSLKEGRTYINSELSALFDGT